MVDKGTFAAGRAGAVDRAVRAGPGHPVRRLWTDARRDRRRPRRVGAGDAAVRTALLPAELRDPGSGDQPGIDRSTNHRHHITGPRTVHRDWCLGRCCPAGRGDVPSIRLWC